MENNSSKVMEKLSKNSTELSNTEEFGSRYDLTSNKENLIDSSSVRGSNPGAESIKVSNSRIDETEVSTSNKEDLTNTKSISNREIFKNSKSIRSSTFEIDAIKISTLVTNKASELISVKSPTYDNDLSVRNSYISSHRTSLSKNTFTAVQKNSTDRSESLKKDSSTSNESREVYLKHGNLDSPIISGEIKSHEQSLDNTNIKHEIKDSTSQYISPLAKSFTKSEITPSHTSIKSKEIQVDPNPVCVPPWAKTLRKYYGMTYSDSTENVDIPTDTENNTLQEKITKLMEKHSRLMLVKRGEERKQLILKPSESGGMGTVKMTSKNTRYYMTPLPRDDEKTINDQTSMSSRKKSSLSLINDNSSEPVMKKTSKSQAKTEVSHVLKSLYNTKIKSYGEMSKDNDKFKHQQIKCPKITPSTIREYINTQNLDSDERKLHEIIKIKKVPSLITSDRKPSSKYIINVPISTKDDRATVNKIKVKEKRKLRHSSHEDINENVTEIIYNQGDSKKQEKLESNYTARNRFENDVVPYSKNKRKSLVKSKTFEVTAESTPIISELVKKEKRDRDKILLIQYEKRPKHFEGISETDKKPLVSTQLLGIKEPCKETGREMYFYGTETDGKRATEKITKVDCVSPTLRDKVNMIFQELREMAFKPCGESESTESQSCPSVSSKTIQHPSALPETDAVSVQALPEVRSAEVQVRESMILAQMAQSESHLISAPHSVPTSLGSKASEDERIGNLEGIEGKKSTEENLEAGSQFDTKLAMEEPLEEVERTDDVTTDFTKYSADDERLDEVGEKGSLQKSILSREGTKSEGGTTLETQEEKEESKEIVDDQMVLSETEIDTTKDDHPEGITLEEEEIDKDEMMKDEDGLEKDKNIDDTKDKEEDINEGEDTKKESNISKEEEEASKEEIDKTSDKDKVSLAILGKKLFSITEDIRSYDFSPSQESELRITSSSKFFYKKDSIRKLNWTDDILYLEKNTCPQLVKGLAEIAVRQPSDPISYLANWIYKDYHNRENEEKKIVYKEHLQVAKGTLDAKNNEELVCRKFSVRKYPMKRSSAVSIEGETSHISETSHVSEETEHEELENDD